jgi:hypothetical protein
LGQDELSSFRAPARRPAYDVDAEAFALESEARNAIALAPTKISVFGAIQADGRHISESMTALAERLETLAADLERRSDGSPESLGRPSAAIRLRFLASNVRRAVAEHLLNA